MRATCWMGVHRVEVREVADPKILNERDAIVRVTSTAICGSDLHLLDGYIPTMEKGDILGHEFMGEVVEIGGAVTNLQIGDRVVVPFPIACGSCLACGRGMYSLCENSNPNAGIAEKAWGSSTAGHLRLQPHGRRLRRWAGRVRSRPVRRCRTTQDRGRLLSDEQVLFLTDILPTGYMGAEMCDIKPGDTVAVWGAGGQFAMASAYLLGAERVVAIDRFPYRLDMAARNAGAEPLNYEEVDVREALRDHVAVRCGSRLRHLQEQARRLREGGHDPLAQRKGQALTR